MPSHIVIDGNAFYEIDDDCIAKKRRSRRGQQAEPKPPERERTQEEAQCRFREEMWEKLRESEQE